MNPMPELSPMLKQLRLSGILDSLEIRNREAIAGKLAYTDFLALLIADEIARRENKKFTTRVRRAGFRSHKTIEQFDFDFIPTLNRAVINDLATCRFVEERANVLIAGECGTGKSHLAQALGHCAVRQGYDVSFCSQTQLLGALNAARATATYERRFQALVRVPVLIIDDFALKPLRSPADEDLHDLIAERYERSTTVITSNLDLNEWGDAFPNRLLGAATIDRLRHGAHCLTLVGESYRAPRPSPETTKSSVAKQSKNGK
jgi:DNA replication protein DnaC